MLTDEEIDALAGREYPTGGPRLVALRHAIREAVRLTAERCLAEPKTDELRLALGELTAQEIRSIKAAFAWRRNKK